MCQRARSLLDRRLRQRALKSRRGLRRTPGYLSGMGENVSTDRGPHSCPLVRPQRRLGSAWIDRPLQVLRRDRSLSASDS
ncbi:hypothetical protein GUITHDRAFT_151559 [Guillardia theta CCMP2712]|uniref:Uncharacterized protein n=1 Tax=Guillardia theta (strain CCMP2712) TaxID=905079 RepID=L1JLQ0_GUITC|nr:hypothetical protein GUITHDRAFT_151559 [Guillardia theta CCMP2712]EKX49481.1 hypothetical protein GUITHDRAFT_151559 [Guillardia theta CCMP2712]|eukprot:XP_005836461.1 hypothetical protein GUITHDRAFT_151559 [Guillardia theta CCMP2712]